MRRQTALTLSLALLLAPAAVAGTADSPDVTKAEEVGMSSERLQRIVPGMRSLIDAGKIPGTVTLVARQGKVVHFEAAGERDVDAGLPMERDTIFRLYSQSKPVTGVAVMILFEEGHFLLSDPVAKYLPELADVRVYTGMRDGEVQTEPARPMTIHHLLTHTSGLTYEFLPSPVAALYRKHGITGGPDPETRFANLEEWSRALAEQPLVAQPGTRWNYSVGMDVLGRLVEVVSGQRFGEFLEQRIFDPLGMVDTGFWVPAEKIERFAANYSPKPGGGLTLVDAPQTSPYRKPPALEMGGAGLVGTVGDYLRFAQMLLDGGELDGVRILGRKTVELMMLNHLGPEFPPDPLSSLYGIFGGGRAWGVGFGLTGAVVTDPALTGLPGSKGAFSWGGAATTHFWVDPQEDLLGIVHTQLLPDGTYPVRQLMQLLTYQAIVD